MAKSADIDVWEVITSVLRKHEPVVVLAFFGHFYFQLPPSKLAFMLDEETDTIRSWLAKVRTDIKRAYRASGGILERGEKSLYGKTISPRPRTVIEDQSKLVDGEEYNE